MKAAHWPTPAAPPNGIFGYQRVSSRAQDTAMQQSAIEGAAQAQGVVIAGWYSEKASGKSMARPELVRLRADIRAGVVRHLLVFKLDRITRSGVADTYAFLAEARKAGCVVQAVADNLTIRPDSDDMVSEVLTFALSLAARIERTAINDRIAAARSRVEAEGGHWGRPPRMTPAQLERARVLKADGVSVRDIAQKVGVPRSTVHAALSRKDRPIRRGGRAVGEVSDPPPVHV